MSETQHSQHSYPKRAVQKVAAYMAENGSLAGQGWEPKAQDLMEDADVALQGLHESQEKSPLTAAEVQAIWQLVNVASDGDTRNSTEARHELRSLLVKHAPGWGDAVKNAHQ